jgi:hypothetical protein
MGCEDYSIAPSAIAQLGSPSNPVKRIIFLHNRRRHCNLIIVNKWLIYGKLTVKRHYVRIFFPWTKYRNKMEFYRGILSDLVCIHANDEAKNKMDQAAKTHIQNVMAKFG